MRRVVVTGVGAVTPCGADTALTWSGVVEGRSAIRLLQGFDAKDHSCKIGGECIDFDPLKYIEKKRLREGARFIHMSLAAAQQAVDASGFAPSEEEKERVGTYVGVGLLGLEVLEAQHKTLLER